MKGLLSTGIGLFTIWTGLCNVQLVNNVVPGLSQVTPVYSNITTTFMGREINNEWKFISHYEYVQIRNGRGVVGGLPQVDSETLQDIQEDLDRELEEAFDTFEEEMDNLVEELTGESEYTNFEHVELIRGEFDNHSQLSVVLRTDTYEVTTVHLHHGGVCIIEEFDFDTNEYVNRRLCDYTVTSDNVLRWEEPNGDKFQVDITSIYRGEDIK